MAKGTGDFHEWQRRVPAGFRDPDREAKSMESKPQVDLSSLSAFHSIPTCLMRDSSTHFSVGNGKLEDR